MNISLKTVSIIIAIMAGVATIYGVYITDRNQSLEVDAAKTAAAQSVIQTEYIKLSHIPHFSVSVSTVTSKSENRKDIILLTSDGGKIFDLTSEVLLDVQTFYHDPYRAMTDHHLFVEDYFIQRVDVLKNTVEISYGDPKILFKVRDDVRKKYGSTNYPRMTLVPRGYIKINCNDINQHPFTQIVSFGVSFNSATFGSYEKMDYKDYQELSDTYDHIHLDELDAERLLNDQALAMTPTANK